jgi:hypothetical protein
MYSFSKMDVSKSRPCCDTDPSLVCVVMPRK